ncbi:hypothetical protein [Amphibacillus sediminis]|uniref:hypothetical protein n=1 Tax=Amphibacillus sediminis TaxID=360185 RepID=UPI00083023E9|nr:hypothetical protein [Amphibacillus sediminis]
MKVLLSPQRSDDEILYSFNDDVITVYYNGIVDTFDFSGVPDGQLVLTDEDDNSLIETSLPFNPIELAYKENGILHVKIRYFYKQNATEEERFPEWTDSNDLKVGVYNG